MTMPSPRDSQAPAPGSVSAGTNAADTVSEGRRRGILIGIGAGALVVVALLIGGAYFLLRDPLFAASVRDVFIIFMALEFMLIGVALVILIVQLAVLTNMLQHEIKPILESTNETVSTVRGTTAFLSENVVEPVIKLNAYLAALSQVVETLGIFTRFGRRK